MVGLGSCLTLAEVDDGWDIGKAVSRGLADMIFKLDKVQGKTYARFTRADLLGLLSQAQEWCAPQKPVGSLRQA